MRTSRCWKPSPRPILEPGQGDRLYKQQLAEKAEAAKIAAVASVHVASNASRELGEKIDSSKAERKQQIEGLTQAMQENTALTQESKDASREALEVANGHNEKILQATELARQALNKSAEGQGIA